MRKSNLKKQVLTTLVMGSLVAMTCMASAEETAPQEFSLEGVVVTANRMENKLVDTPANISVVTSEELSRKNYQSALDAVKNVPGVVVLDCARTDDAYLTINGSERVLVLVDGRRIGSDQGFGGSKGKLDAGMLPNPASIERIEVLKGGGSAVYGADAVGGVINIITKRPEGNKVTLDMNTGSWGTQNYKGTITHREGKTGVFVAASKEKQNYMKYKEYTSNSTKKYPNSSNEKIALNLKLDQEITEGQLLTFSYDHVNKKGGRPGGLNTMDMFGNIIPFAPDKGHKVNNNLALKYEWDRNTDNPAYLQIYTHKSVNDWYNNMKTDERRTGFDFQQTLKTAETNTLVAGLSYYKSQVDTVGAITYDEGINNKAVFLQDSWDFAPSWKLNGGLRYDKHSRAGSKTTASFAVNKKFGEDSHAYLSWSQIFNAPTTDDLYYYAPGMIGNPNLKPEKGYSWTLGYDAKLGAKASVNVSAFYTMLSDAINWAPGNDGNWYCDNVDKQKLRGLELNYRYNFDDAWSAMASYAYVKVEDKDGVYGTGFVRNCNRIPNQYKLGLEYKGKKVAADIFAKAGTGGGGGNYYGPHFVKSSYFTVDMSVNYKVKDNWKFYVKGYNLTNSAYFQRSGTYPVAGGGYNYSYPAAGRAFLVGTEISF